MAKKRYPQLPEIEERTKLLRAAASKLVHEQATQAVVACWSALIHIWQASMDILPKQGDLYLYGDSVLDFMGKLERQVTLNLPTEIVATLEGRANGTR